MWHPQVRALLGAVAWELCLQPSPHSHHLIPPSTNPQPAAIFTCFNHSIGCSGPRPLPSFTPSLLHMHPPHHCCTCTHPITAAHAPTPSLYPHPSHSQPSFHTQPVWHASDHCHALAEVGAKHGSMFNTSRDAPQLTGGVTRRVEGQVFRQQRGWPGKQRQPRLGGMDWTWAAAAVCPQLRAGWHACSASPRPWDAPVAGGAGPPVLPPCRAVLPLRCCRCGMPLTEATSTTRLRVACASTCRASTPARCRSAWEA